MSNAAAPQVTSTRSPDPSAGARSARARFAFPAACAVALLTVVLAYSNSLDNSFHFDDSHVIEENLFIRDVRNVPRFFTDARTFSSIPTNATYRPIVSASLAFDYWRGRGLAPRAFHVSQIVLLILTGTLFALFAYVVLASTGPAPWHGWAALAASTLFCVHTGNTQPVNYISARSELLSGIGVLGTLLVYARLPRARRFQLHLVPMAFGALAKTPAVFAAPLLLAYALFIEQRLSLGDVFSRAAWPRTRTALLSTAPAFVAAAALYLFVESMNPPGQTYGGGGRAQYLLTETWVWVLYAKMFLLPIGLSADTDLGLFSSAADPRVLAGIAFAALLGIVVWWASRRDRTRAVAFGIAWFAIALVPSSSIFPLAEVMNDHRVFFPFMGLSLATVAWLFGRWGPQSAQRASRAPVVLAAALIAVIAIHAVATHRRNRVWQTEETLWADVVRKSPKNGRGWMNYGLTQMAQGRYPQARELFQRAQVFNPNYATLEVNLGIVENALGNAAGADSHFTRALDLNPAHPAPHRYYARWLIAQGRAGEAIPHLRRTIELSPADLEARHMLMSVYAARGDAELRSLALETLALLATDSLSRRYAGGEPAFGIERGSWYRTGLDFTSKQQHLEAAQAYRAAVAEDSTNADAWNNLGWSLGKAGFYDDAVIAFRSALRHRPGLTLAANNLAWAVEERSGAEFKRAFALQQTGHVEEAVAIYRSLARQFPTWVNTHYNLGHALMTLGRPREAVVELRRALELNPNLTAAHLHLANCLAALGDSAESRRERARYEQAGPAMPTHPLAGRGE